MAILIQEALQLLDEIAAEGHPAQVTLDKFRADLSEKLAEETRLRDQDTDAEEDKDRLRTMLAGWDMSSVPY